MKLSDIEVDMYYHVDCMMHKGKAKVLKIGTPKDARPKSGMKPSHDNVTIEYRNTHAGGIEYEVVKTRQVKRLWTPDDDAAIARIDVTMKAATNAAAKFRTKGLVASAHTDREHTAIVRVTMTVQQARMVLADIE